MSQISINVLEQSSNNSEMQMWSLSWIAMITVRLLN